MRTGFFYGIINAACMLPLSIGQMLMSPQQNYKLKERKRETAKENEHITEKQHSKIEYTCTVYTPENRAKRGH